MRAELRGELDVQGGAELEERGIKNSGSKALCPSCSWMAGAHRAPLGALPSVDGVGLGRAGSEISSGVGFQFGGRVRHPDQT
jgi:hypothetical protein